MSKSSAGCGPRDAASSTIDGSSQHSSQTDVLSPNTKLSRRSMLAALGAGCATLLAPSVLAGSPQSYTRKAEGKIGKGQILSNSQLKTLRAMVEVIIPKTDTLGGAGTDTHGFIDDQLAHCSSAADAKTFMADLNSASKTIAAQWGKPYEQLAANNQNEAMTALANGTAPFNESHAKFFDQLKSFTLFGYYSSEVGATKELVYLPIPGGYDGGFKLSENGGKAFSMFTI